MYKRRNAAESLAAKPDFLNLIVLYTYDFGKSYEAHVKKITFNLETSGITVEEVPQTELIAGYQQMTLEDTSNGRFIIKREMKQEGFQNVMEISVTDKNTGKSQAFRGFGNHYFTKHGTLVLNLINPVSKGWAQELSIIKLPEMSVLKEFHMPESLKSGNYIFSPSQIQYSMQAMTQTAGTIPHDDCYKMFSSR